MAHVASHFSILRGGCTQSVHNGSEGLGMGSKVLRNWLSLIWSWFGMGSEWSVWENFSNQGSR